MPSSVFSFQHFKRKTELLSYLILCVAKMPFIPPVSIARPPSLSGSGLTGKERPMNSNSLSATPLAKTKALAEDKGSSVKERLTLNLRQLGRKSQPRSHLPIGKGVSGSGLHVKSRDRWLPSSKVLSDSFPSSSSGESMSKIQQHNHGSHDPVKSEPEARTKSRHQETHFTLTLTPEAVLLLQRRSNERQQRLMARNPGGGAGGKRENLSRRHQPAARHSTSSSRTAIKNNNNDLAPGDINSLVKVSLLNEQYKYDDVEYEEEEDCGVDERVVLKCTEWLRGLENAPVTMATSMHKGAVSLKSSRLQT
ncbi:uncharacterized protein ACJ7VT_018039 [Polymixia lowei]